MSMAQDAASGWVKDEVEDGKKPPFPSRVEDIKADEYDGCFVRTITVEFWKQAENAAKASLKALACGP